jgi:hypothetical protein
MKRDAAKLAETLGFRLRKMTGKELIAAVPEERQRA